MIAEFALALAGVLVFVTVFVNATWWLRDQTTERRAAERIGLALLAAAAIVAGVIVGPWFTVQLHQALWMVVS